MLGAVKAKRAAAEKPEDEADRQRNRRRKANGGREQEEAQGGDEREGEQSALAWTRHTAAAKHWRERRCETNQAP